MGQIEIIRDIINEETKPLREEIERLAGAPQLSKTTLLNLFAKVISDQLKPLREEIGQLSQAVYRLQTELNDSKMRVSGLNRTISYLKNTGKLPEESEDGY